MIQAGKYSAKATAIRFIKSPEKGTLALEVAFNVADGAETHKMTSCFWLSPAAIERSMKTLVDVLEFTGDDAVVSVPAGNLREGELANQDAINRTKELSVVIEMESYTGKDGTERFTPRIKWVNNVGGSQFAGVQPEVLRSDLAAVNFKAMFLAAKQGATPATKSAPF